MEATEVVGALPPGAKIDTFVVQRVRGAGGFGITYEVEEMDLCGGQGTHYE